MFSVPPTQATMRLAMLDQVRKKAETLPAPSATTPGHIQLSLGLASKRMDNTKQSRTNSEDMPLLGYALPTKAMTNPSGQGSESSHGFGI